MTAPRRLRILALLPALLAGCATIEAPFSERLASPAAQVRECAEWFRTLDDRVARAGVRDAQDARVPGFPYLRANRLLAALRPAAEADAAALRALAERMRALDLEARRYELMNLPTKDFASALDRTQQCGRLLSDADLAQPELRQALLARVQVPDDYRQLNRIAGLYPVTRLFFAGGVRRYQEETLQAFGRQAARDDSGLTHYAPPPGPRLSRARVAQMLERAAANPLGIPEPDETDLQDLLAVYAPSFEVEVKGDYDRFGALRWLRGSDVPGVDGGQLAVYANPAWTLYRGRVLLQLVYTIWFAERPPQAEGDILAGKLDGVTWRVTLAPDGEPLVYDTIHPCGCYHLFFPTPRARARPAPDGLEEWMFSPQSLPRLAEGERPLVRIASGTHYVERVGVARGSDSLARYELRSYGDLRSLQRLGARASAFGPDGLIAGTGRPERRLFWPMGIVSAGAMRQWGRQATAFVGRRHFDDADLFEKRFVFDLDGPPCCASSR